MKKLTANRLFCARPGGISRPLNDHACPSLRLSPRGRGEREKRRPVIGS